MRLTENQKYPKEVSQKGMRSTNDTITLHPENVPIINIIPKSTSIHEREHHKRCKITALLPLFPLSNKT